MRSPTVHPKILSVQSHHRHFSSQRPHLAGVGLGLVEQFALDAQLPGGGGAALRLSLRWLLGREVRVGDEDTQLPLLLQRSLQRLLRGERGEGADGESGVIATRENGEQRLMSGVVLNERKRAEK